MIQSGHNFAHATAIQMLWNVQNVDLIVNFSHKKQHELQGYVLLYVCGMEAWYQL